MSECVWAFLFLSHPLPFPFVGGGEREGENMP
jgi:hypothetical protein